MTQFTVQGYSMKLTSGGPKTARMLPFLMCQIALHAYLSVYLAHAQTALSGRFIKARTGTASKQKTVREWSVELQSTLDSRDR